MLAWTAATYKSEDSSLHHVRTDIEAAFADPCLELEKCSNMVQATTPGTRRRMTTVL